VRVSVISRRKRAEGQTIADDYPGLASLAAYGDRVRAKVFRPPAQPKRGPGGWDPAQMQAYLRREGYAGQLMAHATSVHIEEYARGNEIVERALKLKGRMQWVFRRELDPPVAKLAAGVALGRRREAFAAEYRGRPLAEIFAASGISHILAVSGLHVSMVAGTVFGLLRKLRLPRLPAAVAGSLAVWFFVLLTGGSVAAVRAGTMNTFGLVFYGLGMKPLEKAALAGLCVAAWISLLPNPLLIGAVGFQLSFGAVLALILLTPRVDELLRRTGGGGLLGLGAWVAVALGLASRQMDFVATLPGFALLGGLLVACLWAGHALDARHAGLRGCGYARLPAMARGLISTQIAIQAGLLLPLSGWYFERFSLAGCLVNLFAIPLSNLLIQATLLCGLLGTLPGIGAGLAGWAAIPANALGIAFLDLAHRGADLFGYPAVARPGWQTLAAYYALLALAVAWLDVRWRSRRLAAHPPAAQASPAFL
jgi:ComEC/Rec2-related protein